MTEAEQERARVVAWLRREADEDFVVDITSGFALQEAADAIERGDHITTGKE